jgi:hypothetical protein
MKRRQWKRGKRFRRYSRKSQSFWCIKILITNTGTVKGPTSRDSTFLMRKHGENKTIWSRRAALTRGEEYRVEYSFGKIRGLQCWIWYRTVPDVVQPWTDRSSQIYVFTFSKMFRFLTYNMRIRIQQVDKNVTKHFFFFKKTKNPNWLPVTLKEPRNRF